MNKGLYLHWPYCRSKCRYCDFYSLADRSSEERYEKALLAALEPWKEKHISLDTIFFGGGTPYLMRPAFAKRLFDTIRDTFTVTDNAEITLEANPFAVKKDDKLPFFHALGVNRVSFGAQSFHDEELAFLGRNHRSADIVSSVKRAVNAGFERISLDLMTGIPLQTEKSLCDSLNEALALPLDHLSVYGLTVEEKTVFGRMAKKGSLPLPDEETAERLYLMTHEILTDHGLNHYEISNFALPGGESRHNLKYWHGEEYIGIGAAAHSYVDGVRFASPRSIKAFCENPFAAEEEVCLSPKDKARETVMLSLRLAEGFDENCFAYPFTPAYTELKRELIRYALAEEKDAHLCLTPKGFLLSNTVIERLITALEIW